MKKVLTLIAGLLMLSASAETLSLYDGSNWNAVAPFNGMYFDIVGNKTQVLYPAADLTPMVGQQITGITFYTDVEGCSINGGLLNISLGETDATVLNGYITEGMTQVGTLTFTSFDGAGEINITFDNPYTYQGGNLVFENVVVETTGFDYIYCLGMNTNYDNCYVTTSYAGARQFLPKTTFTYGGETPQPQGIRGDVDGDELVTVSDATALIDILLSGGTAPATADANLDEAIGIADVTAIIDFLLSGTWSE